MINNPHTNRSHDGKRAVSPVVGVILMVAITIILATVIAVFVFGLGDVLTDTPPNTQWDASWENDNVTITHMGGTSVAADDLWLVGPTGGELRFTESEDITDGWYPEPWEGTIRAGDSREVNVSEVERDNENGIFGDGEQYKGTYRIIWESGDTSAVLKTFRHPEA